MCSIKNFGHLVSKSFLIMGFIMCLTMGYNQDILAAPQQTWKPDGPLTITLYTLGGAYEQLARQIALLLPEYLGQPTTIRGVTGAEGGNALDFVHRTKPDGRYINLGPVSINAILSVEKRYSWDIKDLPVVLAIEGTPYVIATSAKSPYKSWEELLKARKENLRMSFPAGNFAVVPLVLELEKRGSNLKLPATSRLQKPLCHA